MTQGKPRSSEPERETAATLRSVTLAANARASRSDSDPSPALPPQTDGGAFHLLHQVSESRSSRVFHARDDAGPAIVKLPTPQGAARWEALVLQRLEGTVAPRLLSEDSISGEPALVIEPVAGRTLLDLLRNDPRLAGAARFRRILAGLATALVSLHARGVVHGDLKPDHIFVSDDNTVRLTDFSAATLDGRQATAEQGLIWLTPGFAAPEQLTAGSPVDERTDIFAFGAVAFWAASGHVVPEGDEEGERDAALSASPLPADLVDVVRTCLRSDPAQRPNDATGLLQMLGSTDAIGPSVAEPQIHDEVPPTLQVRRRPSRTQKSGGGGGQDTPRRRGRRVLAWLLLLSSLAGAAVAGVWQGKPLYERYFKDTWLISAAGGGDASSLAEAIARAGSAAVFLLDSGEYAGTTLRNGTYRIEPAPQAEEPPVIVAGREGCLTVVNAQVELVSLVFRGSGDGGGGCIIQSGGRITLAASSMERVPGPAVAARDGATVSISGSTFLTVDGDAIRIVGGGVLLMEDSKVTGASGNAVAIAGGAKADLRRNLISDSGATGLLLVEGAEADLEGDVIRGSTASAIEIASGAAADLRGVTLSDSSAAGIFLHGESRLRMVRGDITNNQLSGIFIDGAVRVDIENSAITDNGEHGVLSLGGGGGQLAGNEIVRNAGYGVVLDPQSRLTLGSNKMDANMSGAVMDARKKKGGGTE